MSHDEDCDINNDNNRMLTLVKIIIITITMVIIIMLKNVHFNRVSSSAAILLTLPGALLLLLPSNCQVSICTWVESGKCEKMTCQRTLVTG